MAVVRELITRFAFNADTKKVNEFDKGLASVAKQARIVAVAVAGAATAAFGFSNSAAKAGDEVAKTARRIGFGTKQLQQYRFALGQIGITQQTVDASLSAFTRRIGEFASKGAGPAANTIKKFGIQVLDLNGNIRGTEEVFRDVLGILSTINSEAERTAFADALFSQSGRAFSLASDIAEIDRLVNRFDELGLEISSAEAEISENFLDSIDELRKVFSSIKNEIGFGLIPQVLKAAEAFKEWLLVNREILRINFSQFFNVFDSLGKAVLFVSEKFNEMNGVLKILTITAALFGLAVLLPWSPWLLAIAGALLLIDDLVAFFEGRGSVIGDVINSWNKLMEKFIRLLNRIPGINIRTGLEDQSSVEIGTDTVLAPNLRATRISPFIPESLSMLSRGSIGRDIGSDISSGASVINSRMITVDSTVNVSVPEGTSREIREAAREQGRLGAMEGFEQVLRNAQNEFPVVE